MVFIILNETELGSRVLGIVDDDKDKQGKKIFGFVVQSPQVIKELTPDAVLITSIKYKDRIVRNLNNNKELTKINFYSL